MTQINPYLSFHGNCREAMKFYQDCFGGELILQSVEESPMAQQWPSDLQKHILHASLSKANFTLLGSDIGNENLLIGNSISLALACDNEKELEKYFTKLSIGGKVTHPLHKFFDGTIGALTDKYGMNWLLKL